MSVVVGNEILDVMSSPRLQLRDRNSRQVLMPAPRGPDGSLRSSARQTVQFPQPAGLVRSTRTRAANYYPTPGYYPMPRSQPQDRFPGSGSIFAPKSNRTRPEGENR